MSTAHSWATSILGRNYSVIVDELQNNDGTWVDYVFLAGTSLT